MTRKPGSSADVNWSLQDCLPQSHAALHQLTVARQAIQAGLQGSAWPSCLHFGLDINFPSQGWSAFYRSKPPPNTSLQATKKPVALVGMKNFHCFCRHKTWFSLFHRWSPRAGVPIGSQESCSKSQSIGGCQLYPCPCCAAGSRGQKGHWYDWHPAP